MAAMTSSLHGRIGFTGMNGQPGSRTAATNVFLVPGRIPTVLTTGLRLRVSSVASVVETRSQDRVTVEDGVTAKENILACPVSYQRLTLIGPPISLNMTSGTSLQCEICEKTYMGNEKHVELIAVSGLKEYTETSIATEFFRSIVGEFARTMLSFAVRNDERVPSASLEREYHRHKLWQRSIHQAFREQAGCFLKFLRWTTRRICCESAMSSSRSMKAVLERMWRLFGPISPDSLFSQDPSMPCMQVLPYIAGLPLLLVLPK